MAPQGETFYTFMGALAGGGVFFVSIASYNAPTAVFFAFPLAIWAGGFIGLSFWRWLSSRNR